jgi:hypothetical protein
LIKPGKNSKKELANIDESSDEESDDDKYNSPKFA